MKNEATIIIENPAAAAGFFIDDYEDTPTGEYTLKDPKTDAPTDVVLILAGPEHPLRVSHKHKRLRKMRNDVAKGGKIKFDDPSDEEEDNKKFIASIILGWNKMPTRAGNIPFSPAAALQLMQDPKRAWIREQVEKAIDERDAFIGSCAGS